MQEILPPGVKHGEKADLRTQVLGVSGNGAHRRAHRPEQNVVDVLFILVGDRSDWLWHRKDDVEVADVEKLRSTVFQPFGASQRLALAAVAVSGSRFNPHRYRGPALLLQGYAQKRLELRRGSAPAEEAA